MDYLKALKTALHRTTQPPFTRIVITLIRLLRSQLGPLGSMSALIVRYSRTSKAPCKAMLLVIDTDDSLRLWNLWTLSPINLTGFMFLQLGWTHTRDQSPEPKCKLGAGTMSEQPYWGPSMWNNWWLNNKRILDCVRQILNSVIQVQCYQITYCNMKQSDNLWQTHCHLIWQTHSKNNFHTYNFVSGRLGKFCSNFMLLPPSNHLCCFQSFKSMLSKYFWH